MGIDPLVDLPVGRGLLDHPGVSTWVKVQQEYALMGWPVAAVAARGPSYWGIPFARDQEEGIVGFSYFLNIVEGIVGSIRLRTKRPDDPPVINHGYWPVAESGAFAGVWEDFHALMNSRAFRNAQAEDLQADMTLSDRLQSELITGAHPAGGCGIGTVVGPDLAVFGAEGLFVVDASVFPRHVTNNPNITVHVIAEIAAQNWGASDFIEGANR
jgi:hypothetical protein